MRYDLPLRYNLFIFAKNKYKQMKDKDNDCLLKPFCFLQNIKNNRTYLMGIAMIFIIIYHFFCWVYNPIGMYNIGYLGVDIFLFLSGFGLCYSYENNSIKTFYKNRLTRIFPLYAISVCIAYILCYNKWEFSTFLANLTTLGYYIDSGINRFDWYINALITLYICFPLFYLYSKLKYIGLIVLTIAVFVFMHFHHMPYWYDCLISRLPIFLYGILFVNCYKSSNIILLLSFPLFYFCRLYSSQFLSTNFLVLPIILISLYILPHLSSRLKIFINFCGKHSLEIYLANEVIPRIYELTETSIYQKVILYVFIEIIMSYAFICINQSIRQRKLVVRI